MQQTRIKIYGKKNPHPWQREVHDYITQYLSRSKKVAETLVIKAARQRFGKSSFSKAELIRFALGVKGSENAYVSPKLNLARKMFKEIKKATIPFIEASNTLDMVIEYKNGSVIRFHSEQQGEALRGFTVSGLLVIDEGSSFKDTSFYELIAPWTTVHKALTIIISTPKFKMGFFYDNYLDGMNNNNPFYKTFDWVFSYNVPISPEDEAKKTKMPILKWKSEYEGIFLDAEGAVFGDFSGCIIDTPSYEIEEIYLGLDFGTGSGQDYTVLTGIDQRGNQRFIWSTNDMTPTDQVNEIVRIVKSFRSEKSVVDEYTNEKRIIKEDKVKAFYAESNSIGNVYISLIKESGVLLQSFTTTADSKRKLIEELQVSIQNKEIGLLKDQEQSQQLSFYESKADPKTNKITYNAPLGLHDDYAIALMLANKAYKRKTNKMYHIL